MCVCMCVCVCARAHWRTPAGEIPLSPNSHRLVPDDPLRTGPPGICLFLATCLTNPLKAQGCPAEHGWGLRGSWNKPLVPLGPAGAALNCSLSHRQNLVSVLVYGPASVWPWSSHFTDTETKTLNSQVRGNLTRNLELLGLLKRLRTPVLTAAKRLRNSDLCYLMDEPWRHYAYWNRSVTEEYIHTMPGTEVSRIVKFTETESKIMVARSWGRDEWGVSI